MQELPRPRPSPVAGGGTSRGDTRTPPPRAGEGELVPRLLPASVSPCMNLGNQPGLPGGIDAPAAKAHFSPDWSYWDARQ